MRFSRQRLIVIAVCSTLTSFSCRGPLEDTYAEYSAEDAVKLRQQTDAGNAEAQYELFQRFLSGDGVQQNPKKAVGYLTDAAFNGHPLAQYDIGLLFYHGQGIQQDYQEAINWFRKAAKQDNAKAQFHLAWMYSEG